MLERRYRGLHDLDACFFNGGKSRVAWYGHKPCNYSRHQAGPVPVYFLCKIMAHYQVHCSATVGEGGWGVGGRGRNKNFVILQELVEFQAKA
jgi:hypothetical protein